MKAFTNVIAWITHFMLFLLLLLPCHSGLAARPPAAPAAPAAVSHSSLFVRHYQKTTLHPKRIIKIQYSLLPPKTQSARLFNAEVRRMLQQEIQNFLKNSKTGVPKFTASLAVQDTVFLYRPHKIISVRYQHFTYYAGQAHPTTTYSVINCDLAAQRLLNLQDIFINPNNTLKFLSREAIKQLKVRQLSPENLITEGAGPDFKNYRNWNFTEQGLLITFDPAQVAAYAFGPQTVLIPYSALKIVPL